MTDPRNTDRDARIIAAATALAVTHGYGNVTRDQIAAATGMASGTVSNYGGQRFTNGGVPTGSAMDRIRDAVLRAAVRDGVLAIVAQGLANREPVALEAPEQLRMAALTGAL